jgi:hypothetical protein
VNADESVGYSITSSALTKMDTGRVRPSDFAVRELTINQKGRAPQSECPRAWRRRGLNQRQFDWTRIGGGKKIKAKAWACVPIVWLN